MQEDVNHETGLEKVIDQVATFKKPAQGLGKGVYELKEELYSEYDVFFFHYTREDQSKSEEVQRARLKAANSPQVLFKKLYTFIQFKSYNVSLFLSLSKTHEFILAFLSEN